MNKENSNTMILNKLTSIINSSYYKTSEKIFMTSTISENSIATVSVRKLRWRYTIALSLIAILIIVSQFIMQSLLANQNYDSNIINIAGRQRMLSQKITKLSYYILTAEAQKTASNYRLELEKTTHLWTKSHLGLIKGNDELGLPGNNSQKIIDLFTIITPHYNAMLNASKMITTTTELFELKRNIEIITHNENLFLNGMNDIVFQYAKEANAKVVSAERVEIALMVSTLTILLLEFLFIFSPAARSLRNSLNKLTQNKIDLENLFAASPTAMLLVDPIELSIIQVNQKAISLIGDPFSQNDPASLNNYLDVDFENNNLFINKLKNGANLNEYEIVILSAHGSVHETLISVRSITFDGKLTAVIGITNISELKKAQQELFHYASFDDMTGLLNRRTGLLFLTKIMAKADANNTTISICYFDIDGLKYVNDQYGHAEGDWLIQTASNALNDIIRAGDAGIRLGGDEFLLILNNCTSEQARQVISRVETVLMKVSLVHKKPFSLDFSYGITTYSNERTITPEELISESDQLMYQSKQAKKLKKLMSNTNPIK